MSVAISKLVWKIKVPQADKLLLLKMADCADEDGGEVRPGNKRIALDCDLSERKVELAIGQYRRAGLLAVQRPASPRRGLATVYRFDLEVLAAWPKVDGDLPLTRSGGGGGAPGSQPDADRDPGGREEPARPRAGGDRIGGTRPARSTAGMRAVAGGRARPESGLAEDTALPEPRSGDNAVSPERRSDKRTVLPEPDSPERASPESALGESEAVLPEPDSALPSDSSVQEDPSSLRSEGARALARESPPPPPLVGNRKPHLRAKGSQAPDRPASRAGRTPDGEQAQSLPPIQSEAPVRPSGRIGLVAQGETSGPSRSPPPASRKLGWRGELAEAVRLWVEACEAARPDMATPVPLLTDKRRKKLKTCLRKGGGLEGWRIAMENFRDTPFLHGANGKGWRMSFDDAIKIDVFARLMEGGYDEFGPKNAGFDAESPLGRFMSAATANLDRRA